MDHRKNLTRIVWHHNHNDQREAIEYARAAGYEVDVVARKKHDETRFTYRGQVQGVMHTFYNPPAESFLFLFTPEATAARWARVWWRLKHPFSPLRDLSWPNREGTDAV